MIRITDTTSNGNINITGLSISTRDDRDTVNLKMVGDKENILAIIVNSINDGLADVNTATVTKSFMNILFNAVVGVCKEQDIFMARRLDDELQRIIKQKTNYGV